MKFKKRELTDLENRLMALATIPTSLGIYYLFLLYILPWFYEQWPAIQYYFSMKIDRNGIYFS